MSKQKLETLIIKYRRPKEHIEVLKKVAKQHGGTLEEFVHICVERYLSHYHMWKPVPIPESLYEKLSEKAKRLNMSTNEYANLLLTKKMVEEKAL